MDRIMDSTSSDILHFAMCSGEKHGSLWPLAIVMKEEGGRVTTVTTDAHAIVGNNDMIYDVRLRAVEMVD